MKSTVDKSKLKEFLVFENAKITHHHYKELMMVCNILTKKYISSKPQFHEELCSSITEAVLERKKNFDPEKDAYNFIFTIGRNTITNFLYHYNKVSLTQLTEMSSKNQGISDFKPPKELERYLDYLTGDVEFKSVRIPKKDVLSIMVFLKYEGTPHTAILPEALRDRRDLNVVLYRLLKDLIEC